jgi:hypothetical protein
MREAVRLFSRTTSLIGVLFLFVFVTAVQAQPRFVIPLQVTDDSIAYPLYIGIAPATNFCIVEADSVNGHAEAMLPPVPPTGIFDARLVWPRAGTNLICFDQGSYVDIRPYTSATQRDTFRVKSQLGNGTRMIISWPLPLPFAQATLRYFDQNLQQNVNINMLGTTTAEVTDAGDPATTNIYTFSPMTSVEHVSTGVPETFALGQNYPNPFNPSTTISFSIPKAAHAEVSVFGVLGQKVATLASGTFSAGYYTATWDGKNGFGNEVASGVYFARMNAIATDGVNFSAVRKLLLMR